MRNGKETLEYIIDTARFRDAESTHAELRCDALPAVRRRAVIPVEGVAPPGLAIHGLHDIVRVPPHLRPSGDACLRPSELHRLLVSASFEPTALHLEHMFLQFGDDPIKPTEMGALHSVARPPGLRIEARSAAEARAADHVLELTAASSPAKEERPALSDVDSPAFTAAGCWRPTAPARENADPRPTSTRAARSPSP